MILSECSDDSTHNCDGKPIAAVDVYVDAGAGGVGCVGTATATADDCGGDDDNGDGCGCAPVTPVIPVAPATADVDGDADIMDPEEDVEVCGDGTPDIAACVPYNGAEACEAYT